MRLTFLGTGTSCGVPTIGCRCYTCTSTDPHDKRLRCSALVETAETRLLIDCGPDFRQQIMNQPFRRIDGILITHAHYDHMGEWTTYALIASLAKSMSMQTLWPVKVCFRCCPTALQSIAIQEYQPSGYTKSVPMNRFGLATFISCPSR